MEGIAHTGGGEEAGVREHSQSSSMHGERLESILHREEVGTMDDIREEGTM